MKTRLSLKKETLAELTPDELRFVTGGAVNSASCTSCACSCAVNSCNTGSLTTLPVHTTVHTSC